MTSRTFHHFVLSAFILFSGYLITGCATTDSLPATVDWDARIGTYTYEQAVAELGAPKESNQNPDGGRTAEWLTLKNAKSPIAPPPVTQSLGEDHRAGGVDQPVPQHAELKPKDEYLRLTFDASGKLAKSSRIYR